MTVTTEHCDHEHCGQSPGELLSCIIVITEGMEKILCLGFASKYSLGGGDESGSVGETRVVIILDDGNGFVGVHYTIPPTFVCI